jgi:protein involved in polysaccharide export with SLBB domain
MAALRNGELAKYNIVIRPHDLIIAPNPVTGEYYLGGHIARVGVYTLPPRKLTLKQAIVSGGMLDGVAIPQRTELIRRIGPSREAFVLVDTNAIFAGYQPDIFLKPNDIVQVGTNVLAPFIAAIRGGFRITYGFGFLYDRNFSPAQSGT